MPATWQKNSIHNSRPTNSLWSCCKWVHRYILDVRDKRKLTKQLLELLPAEQRMSVETAMPSWWFNLRKNGGLRLTSLGYTAFVKNLEIEHYEYSITDPIAFNQHTILKLDRKLQTPYYIHAVKGVPKKIIFFGSREAVVANLYGNLEAFLDNYRP